MHVLRERRHDASMLAGACSGWPYARSGPAAFTSMCSDQSKGGVKAKGVSHWSPGQAVGDPPGGSLGGTLCWAVRAWRLVGFCASVRQICGPQRYRISS